MKHDPDPGFLDHLEWQTQRALRRRDRFARPVSTGALRTARTLVLVLLCAMSGAGLVIGAERIQASREAELLLEQNRIQLTLADSQLDRATGRLEELSALYESGRIDQPSVLRAEREALTTERQRIKITLEREEILASGRAPNLEITAPRVGGRDFGTEYLQLELDGFAAGIQETQQVLEITEARFAAGLIGASERERDLREVRRHELGLQRIQGRMVLRAKFLSGLLDARTTLRRDRMEEVKIRQAEAVMEIELLGRELEIARARLQGGLIRSDAVTLLEEGVEEFRASLELAELELKLLEEQE